MGFGEGFGAGSKKPMKLKPPEHYGTDRGECPMCRGSHYLVFPGWERRTPNDLCRSCFSWVKKVVDMYGA